MQSLFKLNKINNNILFNTKNYINEFIFIRNGSYRNPKLIDEDLNTYTNYEEITNPSAWKFVEQLIPNKLIPQPKYENNLPSGYKPQTVIPGTYPYHISRNKNHMLPIYLKFTNPRRVPQRLTKIRNISGDIWYLEKSIQNYLSKLYPKQIIIPTRINEVYSEIIFRGDYYEALHKFCYDKGL